MDTTTPSTSAVQPKAAKVKSPPPPSIPVGLDLGYGYVKIFFEEQAHTFPSLVAPIDSADLGISFHQPEDIVQVDGQSYLVGQAAAQSEFRFRDQWDSWWNSPAYQALLMKAAQIVPKGATIVTGLPLHLYGTAKNKERVGVLVKQLLKAKSVTVLCQGLGALGQAIKEHPEFLQQRVAIADIGTRTTELVAMARTTFLRHHSQGLLLGTAKIFQRLATQFTETFGRTLDPYEIDEAYRNQHSLTIRNVTLSSKDLYDRLLPLLEDFMEELHGEMARIWDITRRQDPHTLGPEFDSIIFCGVGAHLLTTLLKTRYPHSTILPHSQLANAQGYANLATNQCTTPQREAEARK